MMKFKEKFEEEKIYHKLFPYNASPTSKETTSLSQLKNRTKLFYTCTLQHRRSLVVKVLDLVAGSPNLNKIGNRIKVCVVGKCRQLLKE